MMLAPLPSVAEQMNASLPRWFQVFLGVTVVAYARWRLAPIRPRVRD